jgi:hypothetical protein
VIRLSFVIWVVLGLPAASLAQGAPPPATPTLTEQGGALGAPRPSIGAVPVDTPPIIDGDVLGDPVWERIAPAGGFWQTTPDTGQPASERTELRIAYTRTTLYVGIVCFDRTPQAIVASGARRDGALEDSDSVRLILDTFRDRQNGFVFGTNPNGLEYDAQVVNEGEGGSIVLGGQAGGSGGGFNINWDGSWNVRASVGEAGWSAEFAIPFRTLRYPSLEEQTWGLNVQRTIRRRNESAYWAPLPRQFTLLRLSQAGALENLRIPPQRNLKATPYVLGRSLHEGLTSGRTRSTGDVGGDLKWSITPSLTLDATVNTDFAQVEVDEQQINLNRFNLFYPEKRPFFLENAGLFAVGSPAEVELFFSRRIGIGPDLEAIPLIGGVRVSGQVHGLSVGVLSMQADEHRRTPMNNFSVARLRKDLPNRSSLGAIVVNRQAGGDLARGDDHNRAFALDGRLGLGRYAQVSSFVARTATPGLQGDDGAFSVSAERDSPRWLLTSTFTTVGRHFRPEVGFLSRPGGFRKGEALIFHRYRPADLAGLLEIRPHASYNGYWNPDGSQQSGFAHIDTHWEWRNGYEVHTGMNLTREGVAAPFEIFPGVLVPPGRYDHREAQLVVTTDEGARVRGRLRVVVGGFFGGDRVAVTPGVRVRLGDTLNADFSVARNDIDLPWGRFHTTLGRARLSYSFTPRLFAQALVQYNDRAHLWSSNLRVGWLQQSNTGLFIVYNDSHPLDGYFLRHPLGRATGADRSLVIKFSRMFDLLD